MITIKRKPITINVLNSKNTMGHIVKSCLGAMYYVNVINKPTTDGCDILIISKKDIKKASNLMKHKIIHVEDLQEDNTYKTLRSQKARNVVSNYIINNIKDENQAVEVLSTHGLKALKKPK